VGAIQYGANRLLELPEIGRPMEDDTGRRELFIPFGASTYVLRYRSHEPRENAVRDALALVALAGRCLAWPLPEDARSLAERRATCARWHRLRRGRNR